ncbi:MAG TPA: polynucleotide adenylyltransferase PcnB [Planctomycetota bacterium]|nr:polynucleotide adenylyltransferase PcnB [Planctomycetota bacterium]
MDAAPAPGIDPGQIPDDPARVLRRLSGAGFDAYLVGGCVRDLLLRLHPKDFDIATNARPRQIKRLFRNSRIIGRRFRLVHVQFGPQILEVSTFRAPPQPDEEDPLIRQDNVFGTEEQDAFRRDFTINALFYDLEHARVIDHVGGLEDLAARRMRMIGDPDLRLREDPVRILRAAKFAGRLGFELTPELREAATNHARDLEKAALPRVLEEIYRLLSGRGGATAFRILEDLGALRVILPELSPPPESFYASVEKLGEMSGGGRTGVPQSLMIAVLLAPLVLPRIATTAAHDYEAVATEVMRPVILRLTVARRDATIARHCLAAQMRLLEPPATRAQRRLAFNDLFREVLALRHILGPAAHVDPDPLPDWEALSGQREEGGHGGKRRRRRRRRRGRRGGGGGASPAPPA